MYHTGMNPLKKISRTGADKVSTVKGDKQRKLHKAFLRYHDPKNWPLLREALQRMGRADLIGGGKHQLVPRGRGVANDKAKYQEARGDKRTKVQKNRPKKSKPVRRRR